MKMCRFLDNNMKDHGDIRETKERNTFSNFSGIVAIVVGIFSINLHAEEVFLEFTAPISNSKRLACGGFSELVCPPTADYNLSSGNVFSPGCDRGLVEQSNSKLCIDPRSLTTDYDRFHPDIDAYLNGHLNGDWTTWAINNQRNDLAADEPINWVMYLGGHNAGSNLADRYELSSIRNEMYSISDQLRVGVRMLELDIGFSNGFLRVKHGTAGLTDRIFYGVVKELRDWLDNNPEDIIIAHGDGWGDSSFDGRRLENPFIQYLGDRVYKPTDFTEVLGICKIQPDQCKQNEPPRWPTRRELIEYNQADRPVPKQFIAMGRTGMSYIWPSNPYVRSGLARLRGVKNPTELDRFRGKGFDYENCKGPLNGEAGNGGTESDYSDPFVPVDDVDVARMGWSRIREARTDFDFEVGLFGNEQLAAAVRCNVTYPSMDYILSSGKTPIFVCENSFSRDHTTSACNTPDYRLESLVWSWKKDDFGQHGYAFIDMTDDSIDDTVEGRWTSATPEQELHFACAHPREGEPMEWLDRRGEEWRVTKATGPWAKGDEICSTEYGKEFVFSVPMNGWQNKQLIIEAEKTNEPFKIWLNYHKTTRSYRGRAAWTAFNRPPLIPGGAPDTTPPEIIAEIDGTLGDSGWYRSVVNLNWVLTEKESVITSSSGCKEQYITDDTAGQTFTCQSISKGGVSSDSVTIKADKIAPTIAVNRNPPGNGNGWNNTPVNVTFSCADTLSGVASCVPDRIVSSEGTNQMITGNAKDKAGNIAQTRVTGINIDTTAPTITAARSPLANGNGWNNTAVNISFTCTDLLSGVASCEPDRTVSSAGLNQSVTGSVVDHAGNTTVTTVVPINIDFTAPTITAEVSPLPNELGWNKSPVTVSFFCRDDLSGVASCPAPQVLSSDGSNQGTSGMSNDQADNISAAAVISGIKIDQIPPVVTINVPVNTAEYVLGETVNAEWAVNDALSGIKSQQATLANGEALDTASIGEKSFKVSVFDNADNSTSISHGYTVLSAAQAAERVIGLIGDEGLEDGLANSLTQKLQNTIDSANRDNVTAANGQIKAFIKLVEAQRNKKVDPHTADRLIGEAQKVIVALTIL